MSLNPLTPVTDYQSMLNRIFWFTSAAALAAVWLVRAYWSDLDSQLRQIDFSLEFGGDKILPIPGGYLLPALAMGLASRVFRIHGLLARWLGIRERFDIDVIISELARRVNFNLELVSEEEIQRHRHRIMRRAFYHYVGGSEPIIEQQLIHRALDMWSWFWIGLEGAFVFVSASFVLIASHSYQVGAITLASTLALALIGFAFYSQRMSPLCRRAGPCDRGRSASAPTRCVRCWSSCCSPRRSARHAA